MTNQIIDISVPDAATVLAENAEFEKKMAEFEAFSLQTRLLLEKFRAMLRGEPA